MYMIRELYCRACKTTPTIQHLKAMKTAWCPYGTILYLLGYCIKSVPSIKVTWERVLILWGLPWFPTSGFSYSFPLTGDAALDPWMRIDQFHEGFGRILGGFQRMDQAPISAWPNLESQRDSMSTSALKREGLDTYLKTWMGRSF